MLRQQLTGISMAVCLAAASLEPVLGRPMPPSQPRPAPQTQAVGGLQLRVRRLPDAVELVLQDAGLGATLTQQPFADRWQGELRTERPRALQVGPQALALPAEGLEQIRFEGSGTSFRLTVLPTPGRLLGSPVVSSDGRDLVVRFPAAPQSQSLTWMPNLNRPTPVPTQTFVPPLRPRAVAPPVGDMAVGTMTLRNPSFLNVSGPPVTLTTRNAPARDVLLSLARMGGYGFVYVEDYGKSSKFEDKVKPDSLVSINKGDIKDQGFLSEQRFDPRPVTVHFVSENYSRAISSVVLSAGWQARKEGKTIFAGPNILRKPIGNIVSKAYRLNQASADSAADYLANLGALVTKTFQETISATTGVPLSGASTSNPQTTRTSTEAKVLQYGGEEGPLLGLQATTDSRLGTITVIGEASLVSVAQEFLRQLDIRQRQVALSVKILDVTLNNDTSISNSFAFRFGNNFIVNDSGRLVAAFNQALPEKAVSAPLAAINGSDQEFFDFLQAQIVSRNTKILASPTLILQEGGLSLDKSEIDKPVGNRVSEDGRIGRSRSNEAFVQVGTSLVTSYAVKQDVNGNNFCEPGFGNAGLTLGARVEKIDDNGFVTFALSPEISAPSGSQTAGNCGVVNVINSRLLDTGQVRVRDGQTLILTGVLSDLNTQVATKWPLLGDLPLIGQFFRSSSGSRTKNELVIMVTPKIIYDSDGATYGYGGYSSSYGRMGLGMN